jgi:hypothetical protein
MAFNLDLGAQLDDWAKQSKERMMAVYKGSVQEFVSRAQRRIPVDTGFARASIRASFDSMPQINDAIKGEPGKHYSFDMSQITLLINSAKPGQTIYIGWTANYVIYLEWGHSDQAPNGFIGVTALEWPQIVAGEIEKAKASVKR